MLLPRFNPTVLLWMIRSDSDMYDTYPQDRATRSLSATSIAASRTR